MKKTGASLVVYALEQLGIKHTFGIPGVHNTEIYDQLNKSESIDPILVTHEGAASFMADGVSRTSESVGTLVIVPAAGLTHAMSGIGEAFLDGIPMLVISGGVRRDTGKSYQLHQIDQGKILDGLIKKYYLIENHASIISTIYRAYDTAMSGEPGPVYVEIPAEIQMFQGNVQDMPVYERKVYSHHIDYQLIQKATSLLMGAKSPGIYVGWGAKDATEEIRILSEKLVAPVATTMQGVSVFPANHPNHVGVGFGNSSVPAGRKAFEKCDCLLAVGVRFGEIATGSFGMDVPENLIHIDINRKVFDKNYPTKVAIEGDAKNTCRQLIENLNGRNWESTKIKEDLHKTISRNKEKYFHEWKKHRKNDIVSPGYFFESLRSALPDDAIMVVDDGKHTFLSAELFPIHKSKHFISPTDFNCMGYCVPAAIGAKLSNPNNIVVGIAGDGAFLMTGMELLTASTYKVGVVIFVFNDGELGQISQFQKIPLNRKTCTVLGKVRIEGFATATGARYLPLNNDFEIDAVIAKALEYSAEDTPVIVDVKIDYSKRTMLTKGVVKTNLSRFEMAEKIRFIGRAIRRHITG